MKRFRFLYVFLLVLILTFIIAPSVSADEVELNENNTVYIEDVVDTGKDNGYSKQDAIKNKNPHYGWKLGQFALTGFSSKRLDNNGNYVLLKNVGDEVTLYFKLQQDINNLDGNKKLRINEDKNGYDNEFGIKKTNFGKGTLIIRKIDPNGNKNQPQVYVNYLEGLSVGSNTKVNVFEEGDYEVALDYEIFVDNFLFFNGFKNYKIRFNFSVRNGNCMVFPFDVETGEELRNTSITENGFYLDLAESKYLNINIKREVLNDGADGLVEDVRYNRPAKDKEEFREEGIYTITAENTYTSEKTIKKIYVGKDSVLKAYVQTGKSIEEIQELVNNGAIIDNEGNISNTNKKNNIFGKKFDKKAIVRIVVIMFIIGAIISSVIIIVKNKRLLKKVDTVVEKNVDLPDEDKEKQEGGEEMHNEDNK